MSALREWLLGVVAAALVVSLAQALTPEGAVKRVCRLAGGLVLLLAVVSPLRGWTLPALPERAWSSSLTETADRAGEEMMKALIAQRAGAYIADKGKELGCQCEASVTVREEQGWAVPWEAEVRGRWSEKERRALARAIEDDLGIPAERQHFREEGGA